MQLKLSLRQRLGAAMPRLLPGIVRDVLRFRTFIVGSVRRDIEAQFRGSLLGGAWVLIQPLAMISVYTLVFANVMRNRLAGVESTYGYSIYLCAGLLAWTYFAETLGRLQSVFVANANLLKKATFPRICLPLVALGVTTFNFLVISALFMLFLLLSGNWPGWVLLGVLPALAVQVVWTLGLGMLAATVNVFFRDVGQLVNVGLLFWFWLTPIVYPATVLPAWAQGWAWLNPFAVFVHHYQQVFVYAQLPGRTAWLALGGMAVAGTLLLLGGWRVYQLRAPEMADEL